MRRNRSIKPLRSRPLAHICLLALLCIPRLHAQTPAITITTTSPLPTAIVGTSYSQTLKETGGTAPFQWAVGPGLPQGLALDPNTGILAGTPATTGSYSFAVQVTDSANQHANATLALTVSTAPLQIVTVPPLFNGQTGQPYSQTFSAAGGTPPYAWAIASGNTGGLTLDPQSGVLSGTPTAAGTFNFVVQVADSAKANVTQNFSVTITPPSLLLTAGAPLPNGTVGVAYDQKVSVTASGGTAPYTWSLASGSVPGLNFIPATIEFSGTPTTAGTFTFTLKATDSTGATGTRSFNVTIAPAGLTITSNRQLPGGSLNAAYSQTLAATGGTPPYTWSANGLPAGLAINSSTGVISGTPTAAGSFTPVLTVTDNALNLYRDNFTLNVQLPAPPSITITGLSGTAAAAQQISVGVTVSSSYSAAIQGQLILSFQPASGQNDSTIQFSTGGRTVAFSIAAGSTTATFAGGSSQVQLQTGTAAGSVVVSLSNLTAAGLDITPTPAPSATTQIAAAAPVISSVQVIRNADTASGCKQGQICLQVTGYTTAREVTQGNFTFSAVTGQSLQSSAGSITVDESSTFSTWFTTSTLGSQFILVQSFTVTGDPNNVVAGSVTLTNRIGSTSATVNK